MPIILIREHGQLMWLACRYAVSQPPINPYTLSRTAVSSCLHQVNQVWT